MNRFQELSNKFKQLDLIELTRQICENLEEVIVDMNTSQLYEKGIGSNEVELPTPYAPFTIQYKRTEGQPVDRITLKDSGDFHNSFYVKYEKEQFSLWATDGKTEQLVKEWGRYIFGLTKENLKLLIEKDVKPQLLELIRKSLLMNNLQY